MSKMTKLKPCPFCGKKPKIIKSNIPKAADSVQCVNQYCPLWDTFTIEEWNRRAK